MTKSSPTAWRTTLAGSLVVMILTALFYSVFYNRFLGLRSGAGDFPPGDAIVHGLLPYRDYFSATPPLSWFKAGLLLSIFGDKLIVLRTAGLIERSLIALIVYLWLCRLCRPAHAAIAAFAALVLSAADPSDPINSYNHDCMLLAILSGYLAGFVVERTRSTRSTAGTAIAAGAAAGLSLLAKQTIGLGAVVAVPLVVAAIVWRRQSLRQALLWFFSFVAGAASPVGVLLAWLASIHVLRSSLTQIFIKGPAAKAQSGGGDFVARALMVAVYSPRQFLLAASGAAILLWLLLRACRSPASRDESDGPAWEMPSVALAGAGAVALGVALALRHLGQAHARWPANTVILMCIGILSLLAIGTWQLLSGSMNGRQAQVYLFAAVSFNIAFMLSLSFPLFPAVLLPGIGLLLAGGLAGSSGTGRIAIYSVVLLLCTNLTRMKLEQPFNFGFFGDGPVGTARFKSNQPMLEGIYLPKATVGLVDGVCGIVAANTTPADTIFTYPEMGIFYTLSDRKYPTLSGNHNVDVVSDDLARSEAVRLLANPPKVLVYLPEDEDQMAGEEHMWRHGHRMGQRDIIAAVESLAKTYRLAGVYATLPANQKVYVYVRPY